MRARALLRPLLTRACGCSLQRLELQQTKVKALPDSIGWLRFLTVIMATDTPLVDLDSPARLGFVGISVAPVPGALSYRRSLVYSRIAVPW